MTETEVSVKPRLAFAGVGWIGQSRMKAAVESSVAEITVVSDPSADCLRDAQKIAPGSKACLSFEEAVTTPGVDGIVIATPSALHMEQAKIAFEHGKAVFCQKPIGRNANEVRAVIDAAVKANKLLGADFSYRYTAAFQKIFETIRSGKLGKIFAIELKFHNAYGPDKPWFYEKRYSGGGCVLDLGIHLIDLMLYALDFPQVHTVKSNLFYRGKPVVGQEIVEDYADVSLTLEGNISAHLSCSWKLNAGCDAIIEASFFGTEGGVTMKNVNGSFYDFDAYQFRGTQSEQLVSPPDNWGGRALIDWIGKLSVSSDFSSEAEEFYHSAEVIDRIYGQQ